MKTLIVIDMQYDFINGALANPAAEAIIPGIVKEIETNKYDMIIFTKDTHKDTYLNTPEGKHLPIKHCVELTHGWDVHSDLVKAAMAARGTYYYLDKRTFGSIGLCDFVLADDEVYIVGTCTDICVLNNALILKTLGGEVNVIGNLCAGLTPEWHKAALEIMEHNHINVINV